MPISSVIQRLWVLIASNPIQSLSNLFPFRIQVHSRELSSTSLSLHLPFLLFLSHPPSCSLILHLFSLSSLFFLFGLNPSFHLNSFNEMTCCNFPLLSTPVVSNCTHHSCTHFSFPPHPNSKVIQRKVMEKKHGFHFQLFRLSISFSIFEVKRCSICWLVVRFFSYSFLTFSPSPSSFPLKSVYQKEE